MAAYTVTQMTAGVLGEVLTGGTAYTFTIATPAYTSQSVYFGSATLTTDSSTITNTNLQGSSTNAKVGALKGGLIPLSNVVDQITGVGANSTFTFDVDGDLQGSGAQIDLTATAGTITRAKVVRGGQNFTSGDGITISQTDLQAAGFTNADASQQLDLFPDHIEGNYISSDFTGTFANFTTDVSQSNFVSSSDGFSFGIKQAVGSGAGTFDFTPTTTIPVNSYLIKSTGHITLNISPA
tara:strand:+ start:1610 stop:2323 length:714 start_codon:yes stop_codon:yes gene_type:complete